MALKDGITYGNCMDVCRECVKEHINGTLDKEPKYGDLEYKEVFKINHHGSTVCYCMEHFNKLLGNYMLVDKTLIEDEKEEEKPKNKTKKKKTSEEE